MADNSDAAQQREFAPRGDRAQVTDSPVGARPVVLLMGPTASGKSQVALALAQRFDAEIVSVDSAQVYRGMDIGTAKPSAAQRALVPHHLIDIRLPSEPYSAGEFVDDARRAIEQIHARGRLPLLVGGTMLYFHALTRGLASLPRADAGMRAEIEAQAARDGWPALHAALARVDPAGAARIKPTDAQRIQRALEVFRVSGRPLTQWQSAEGMHGGAGRAQSATSPFKLITVALRPVEIATCAEVSRAPIPRAPTTRAETSRAETPRAELHNRIASRFRAMLAAGLLDELRALRAAYVLEARLPSMRCVGYRQAWQSLEGAIDHTALEAKGIAATRQLAKRQLTWLRSMPGVTAFDCLAPDVTEQVGRYIATHEVSMDHDPARGSSACDNPARINSRI